jgi:large conductance mechanosensitive channel
MIREFKEFAMRGNLLDLAVAVILGLAFGAVVVSFVDDILMQVIAGIFGQSDFSGLTFEVGEGVVRYGAFLNAVINFVLVALALFLVIRGYNQLILRGDTAAPGSKACPYCVSQVPVNATRCPNCTSDLGAAA